MSKSWEPPLERGGLISALWRIHNKNGYLDSSSMESLAESSPWREEELWEVASFFEGFQFAPPGRHSIHVCTGTACHLKGAEEIYQAFRDYLKIAEGQWVDPEGEFELHKVACLGCCMLAPAVQAGEEIFGPVAPGDIPRILEHVKKKKGGKREASREYSSKKIEAFARTCLCSSCKAAGSSALWEELHRIRNQYKLNLELEEVACTGEGDIAPWLGWQWFGENRQVFGPINPQNLFYFILEIGQERWPQLNKIYRRHRFLRRLIRPSNYIPERPLGDRAWSTHPIVSRGMGEMNPHSLDSYAQQGGLVALDYVRNHLSPKDLMEELKKSGLRGRGGGGFYTYKKWESLIHQDSKTKYLICNGDEGDPGAFMDRMLLESFPNRVLEGILISAWAIRAEAVFILIRQEYKQAHKGLIDALNNWVKAGWIGKIFDFPIYIIESAGAFVCGEETALLNLVEGKRPEPRVRPPYPSESGLWGLPTLINNVETFANLPMILGQRFQLIPAEKSGQTKTFALAGKVKRNGLIEVEMGTTLRELLFKYGLGAQEGRTLKAIQIGGPSGGCLPPEHWDRPLDFDSLQEVGAIMGSGGVIALDDRDCMVDTSRYFMEFASAESCGRCLYCRDGIPLLKQWLTQLTQGEVPEGIDLNKIEKWAQKVGSLSQCGLGQGAVRPLLTSLSHFREEFQEHLNGTCRAEKCKELLEFLIGDKCIGCTRCVQKCPSEAIEGIPYQKHSILQDACIQCGACKEVCPTGAVYVH